MNNGVQFPGQRGKRLCAVRAWAGLLFLSICLSSCTYWPRIEIIQPADEKELKAKLRIILPEGDLPPREKLTYNVRWLGMSVGTLTTAIKGSRKYKGRDVYVLEATMQTNSFLSSFYKIDDRFISFMDKEKKYTLFHRVQRSDGAYRKNAFTEFDQVNHKAHFKNFTDKSEKDFDIPPNVQDVLSAYYYFMLLPLGIGDRVEYQVCNNEKNYRFYSFVQSKAMVTVPELDKKKRETFRMQPNARFKGKKVDQGSVEAYFSCEKRRLPLHMVVKGPVFTEITVTLVKIENEKPPRNEKDGQEKPLS